MAVTALIQAKEQEFAKLSADIKQCRADMETEFAEKQTVSPENQEKFDKIFEKGVALRTDIEKLYESEKGFDIDTLRAKQTGFGNPMPEVETYRSAGAEVVNSEDFKNFANSPTKEASITISKQLGNQVFQKGIYNYPATAASVNTVGAPIQAQREPEVYVIPRKPLTLVDLIPSSPTDSTSIEQVIMYQRTNNAGVVKDWDSAKTPGEGDYSQKFGQMSLSDLSFRLVTTPLYDVSHGIPVHRNSLKDNAYMQSLIDQELTDGLNQKLETMSLTGTGTDEFQGLLTVSGRLTRAKGVGSPRGTASDTNADTIRRAMTDLTLSFFQPDVIVVDPTQCEKLELDKGSDGHYTMIYDPVTRRLWRVALLENFNIASTKAMVASIRSAAKMFYRQDVEIREGEPGNFFLQNAVVVAGNIRALLTIPRPAAICEVTGL